MKSKAKIELGLFVLLVAFGVLGRWFQPQWFFTPTVAVALFAGYYFNNRWLALLVPTGVLAISNLFLPNYDHAGVMAVVYLAFALPVVLGWHLRSRPGYVQLAVGGLLPAAVFYLATNFAVWLFLDWYPHSVAGLTACYAAGLPFFRWMLTGDVLYTALLFGTYAFAVQQGYLPGVDPRPVPAAVASSRR
jgi:hypothetical protein